MYCSVDIYRREIDLILVNNILNIDSKINIFKIISNFIFGLTLKIVAQFYIFLIYFINFP